EGLIQPITVRQLLPMAGDREDPGFEMVSGERRLRAGKLLGWTVIEARIISVISEGEVAAKGLIENLQREDLNPIEEAEGFQQLLDLKDSHWNQDQIAKVTGKSNTYISRSLDILGLPKEIVDNLRARKFSRSHGVELLR